MSLTNYDDTQYNEEPGAGGESPEPEKKPSNRNFLLAIGILGVIFILALILLLVVAPRLTAQQNASRQETAAVINAANTATAAAATAQRQTQLATTPAPTSTKAPVVITVKTSTPIPTATSRLSQAEMATVQALQTQMASGGGAATATSTLRVTPRPTATALPTTGFADDTGLPGLLALAGAMILVIFLARRIRFSEH
jgi:cytoskeletal protein RodZ